MHCVRERSGLQPGIGNNRKIITKMLIGSSIDIMFNIVLSLGFVDVDL